jgi:hypothetical protein
MALKINATYATEIYCTRGGYVAIKQEDPTGGDDSSVLLSAEQLGVVIKELQALYDAREEWADGFTERTGEAAESA